MAGLQFATFTSQLELPFYPALFASKLDHDKLDDSARCVLGLYEPRGEENPNESTKMQIHGNALTSKQYVPVVHVVLVSLLSVWGPGLTGLQCAARVDSSRGHHQELQHHRGLQAG